MTITSFSFFVLVFLGCICYYIVPKKIQWLELLVLSIVFYFCASGWKTFIFVILSAFSVYGSALLFEKVKPNAKKVLLIICIIFNVSLWFVFKGKGLWQPIISFCVPSMKNEEFLSLIGSLGMGYYTLQILGYLIDCYWGNITPLKNPLKVLLFTCYFPQLITGPISRFNQLEDLFVGHKYSYDNITSGVQRIVWGMFKKLVIAERVAPIIPVITEHIWYYNGFYTWIAILVYPIQMYADFSGCMDIVLGVSELFSIKMPENFNTPFFSRSSQEFWQRWHITLGTWAKDYVLYPLMASNFIVSLGKKLKSKFGKKTSKIIITSLCMAVLWLVMGIWHGGYQFIVGVSLWYWTILMCGDIFSPALKKVNELLRIKTDSFSWHLFQAIRTYLIYAIGAVFFSQGIKGGITLITQAINVILKHRYNPWIFFDGSITNILIDSGGLVLVIIGIVLMLIVGLLREKYGYARIWIKKQNIIFRWTIWISLFFIVLLFGKYGPDYDASVFIYQGF